MTVEAMVDGQRVSWRDKKRYLWVLGTAIPLIPLLIWGFVAWTGWPGFYYFGPFFVFVLIPLFDLLAGLDPNNPPDELIEALEEDRYYRYVTYGFIPLQIAGFLWGCFLIGDGTIFGWDPFDGSLLPGITETLAWYEKLGLATAMGMVAGIGINTAHELGHKKEEHERWFARVALAQTAYGHFYIEHNRGHHVRVATPEDPASSRLGETVWEFLPRTVLGSLRSAWSLEAKRFARLKKSPFSLKNDLINAWMFTVLLWGLALAAFGIGIFPYLLVQAVLGIWLLESVNYLEHYGMRRQKLDSGRYERVNPSHSWNSNNIGTNVLLYHLQRHSDHHANPTRRYQALRDFKHAPVLPTGYAGMIVATWVPAFWRRVMDRRVLSHYDGDLSRVNLHPRTAARYEARYGAGQEGVGLMARFVCPNCEYVYDEAVGDPREGWPAGTVFDEIDPDWTCPDCGVREQVDFVPEAEFDHNDQDGVINSAETRAARASAHAPAGVPGPGREDSTGAEQQ